MYRSIVAGTDGSTTAQEAVRHAAALAELCAARLTVVAAYRPVTSGAALAMSGVAVGVGMMVSPAEMYEQQEQQAAEILEHAVMRIERPGLQLDTVARPGSPAQVLLDVATDVDADLIVVGSRGMQGAERFLLGSVPNRITHHASCAVLVVHTC